MEDKKQKRWVGVKIVWSAMTRATTVAMVLLKTTWRWRTPYQAEAAGPKMAGKT
jgi:hypothetical protein